MCGICGVIQIGGEPRKVVPDSVLVAMTESMYHRGPDDVGYHAAPGVALGARRLSIVDVAEGHQPIANEDESVWALQNGELYNHVSIRAELEPAGHRFRTRCDTEILPHLYERDGVGFPRSLRGMFGLAVWDRRRRRAVVARDRLGIKPMYFARVDDLVVFGSELKAVLASGLVDTHLDYDAIDSFLSLGFVPGPRTPLAGVSKLEPGSALVVEPGGVRIERYWSHPEPAENGISATADEWAELLAEELEESVRLRLMSDVPLGAMLSGGLDSSVIVALMARNMSEPVKTFSIGFAGTAENELADARLVSEALGTDHYELELASAQDSVDLEDLVWHLDEPLADLSALGFHALSELAAEHVTVALSGQGADELLGGYRRHRNAALAASFDRLPRPIRGQASRLAAHGPERLRRAAALVSAEDPAERLLAMHEKLPSSLRAELACGALADVDRSGARRAILERLPAAPAGLLSQTLHVDARLGLVDDMLHYFDRMSMASSLEVRVPFLDHHVVELCASIPPGLKVRRGETKHLLRRIARGLVPDRVIDKKKVGFFNAEVAGWLRAQTGGALTDFLLAPQPSYADFLDRRRVEHLVGTSLGSDGGRRTFQALLAVLMLEVWLSTYLPRATQLATSSAATIEAAS